VGGLEPATEYCVSVCIQDDTAGSGYICTGPQSFSTPAPPVVETNPPYYVGKSRSLHRRLSLPDR
jgi:hypothetical protein